MQLFSKRKSKAKTNKPSLFASLGKDPATDWFFSLTITAILIISVALWTGFRFYKTALFIDKLPLQTNTSGQGNTKTKEEQLRDTISIYEKKKADHLRLLDKSQIEVKKEQAAIKAASSTASTTGSSTAPRATSTRAN